MNQMVYSPFTRINGLNPGLGRIFDDQLFSQRESATSAVSEWIPQVDIRELEQSFEVQIDVPGVEAKDIDITLDKQILTIKGSRTVDENSEKSEYRRQERVFGNFARQFSLPDTADGERISARATNGVLFISIPKSALHTPRTIEVQG